MDDQRSVMIFLAVEDGDCDIRTRGVRNVSLKEMIGVLREACRITEKAEVNDLLRV